MNRIHKGALLCLLCLLLLVSAVGCSGSASSDSSSDNTDASKSEASASEEADTASGEFFDANNWATLVADPEGHKGAEVEIVGLIFVDVEKDGDGTYFQMYADPQNMDWNTIVASGQDLDIKANDWVRVTGTVAGGYEGENAFGATLTAPMITAHTVEVVDALAAAPTAGRSIEPGYQSTQNGNHNHTGQAGVR